MVLRQDTAKIQSGQQMSRLFSSFHRQKNGVTFFSEYFGFRGMEYGSMPGLRAILGEVQVGPS